MKYNITLITASIISLSMFSCIDIPQPDLYADPDAITDVTTSRSFLSSVYESYPHYTYELSLLGNDFCPTTLATKDVETLNLYRWQDKQITKFSDEVWKNYYHTIALCNAFLERLVKISVNNEEQHAHLSSMRGEALLIKAMAYFDLLRLYAPPHKPGENMSGIIVKNRFGLDFPHRISADSTYYQIHNLIDEANTLLPSTSDRNGWLTKPAAAYLSAELELYRGNYNEALSSALSLWQSHVIADNETELLWADNSNSSRIFGWYLSSSFYNALQYTASEGDYYALNPQFTFTSSDKRTNYYHIAEMNGNVHQFFGKYNATNKEGRNNRYVVAMRYARMLFVAAEAMVRLGNNAGGIGIVNSYLQKCGADTLSTQLQGNEAIAAIMKEKMKEFAGEGQNYFDLKRIGINLERLNTWGAGQPQYIISAKDYRWVFPIPVSEYRYNSNIQQNEGWQNNGNNQ